MHIETILKNNQLTQILFLGLLLFKWWLWKIKLVLLESCSVWTDTACNKDFKKNPRDTLKTINKDKIEVLEMKNKVTRMKNSKDK